MTAKTPLLLIPRLLCTEILWQHQLKHLGDIAHMQVADVTNHDTIKDMATATLEKAPETFALAGLSMGGYVAQEIMRQAPERVTKLALIDTAARCDNDAQRIRRESLIAQVRRIAPEAFSGVTKRLLPMLIHPDRLEDEALVNDIKAMGREVGRDAYVRQQTAIMSREDGVDDLENIKCPTLILCGREDTLTPLKLHEEMAHKIPQAKLVIIEDSGHLPPLEQPHATTAVLRYWLNDVA